MNTTRLANVFATLFGGFLGLALLKFGNPPIMEKWVDSPANIYEFLLGSPWPITWAYRLLFLLTVVGLIFFARTGFSRPACPLWVMLLPLIWLGFQVLAAAHSVDDQLSWPTLKHLTACAICFYLGLFALARVRRLGWFWVGLFIAFLFVVAAGWEQHFGGLEATRQFFFREIYPQLKEVPPEYLKKLSSNRIFSTLFYPNSLAGALLLLFPIILLLVSKAQNLLTLPARSFLAGLLAVATLGCLFWSGSKGGWLLMLLLALIAFSRLPVGKSLKLSILGGILMVGLAGFTWKYLAFFEKGATSVSARFDYWQAALKTAQAHPLTGTGPGTFSIPYKQLKRPESEMARLVHNDYLEQACDSGWGGFGAYLGFIVGGVYFASRSVSFRHLTAKVWAPNPKTQAEPLNQPKSLKHPKADKPAFNPPTKTLASPIPETLDHEWKFYLWLGVLGWSLQSLFDFGLYLPALAWPAFTFLGLLLGQPQIASTKPGLPHNLPARHENPVPQRA